MVGVEFVVVAEKTNPISVTAELPWFVTSPFPVAVVSAILDAPYVVTEGGLVPPIKYLGISNPFFSNHQHKWIIFLVSNHSFVAKGLSKK